MKTLLRGKTRSLAAALAFSACVSSAGAGEPAGEQPAASGVDPFTGATSEARKLLQEQRLYEQKRRVLQSKFEAIRIQSNLTVLPLRRQLEIAQLKQKIAKALEDTATLDAGVEKTVTVSPPPPPPPPPPPQSRKLGKSTKPRKPGKPRKAGTPAGKTHYIGYYASDGQPSATLLTPEKKRLSLSVGARYGKYRVKRITPASVTLERGKKKWVLHMDEGDYRIANGTGITPSMAQFVATPSGGMDELKQMLLNNGAPPATMRPHTGVIPPGAPSF